MMRKTVLAITALLLIATTARAQDEKFKALFMYNFARNIEWPQAKQSGDFVIGVYGNQSIVPELNAIAEKKGVGSQSIKIKEVGSGDDVTKMHILYVTSDKSDAADGFVGKIKGKGVVVVTDKPGLAVSTSGINYIKVDGKLKYEVNEQHLAESGVKVSQQLTALGVVVK